jgi:hypothetical protein
MDSSSLDPDGAELGCALSQAAGSVELPDAAVCFAVFLVVNGHSRVGVDFADANRALIKERLTCVAPHEERVGRGASVTAVWPVPRLNLRRLSTRTEHARYRQQRQCHTKRRT